MIIPPSQSATATTAGLFLSVADAAEMLGVSPSTVWRWIEADKLPAYRVGPKKIRIRKDDLEWMVQPARDQRKGVSAALERMKKPPGKREIERRQALVARILENRERRVIAPLTTADLIHRVREEEQQSYGKPR